MMLKRSRMGAVSKPVRVVAPIIVKCSRLTRTEADPGPVPVMISIAKSSIAE